MTRLLVPALPELQLRIRREPGVTPPAARLGGVWRRGDGVACGRSYVSPAAGIIDWEGLGRFEFTRGSAAISAWPSPDVDTDTLRAEFAREIEPILFQALGWEALHASAVRSAAGAIALCGASGAGKSTFAYALSTAGRDQWADDHVVLDCAGERPMVYSRPFSRRLRQRSCDYFGGEVASPAPRHAESVPLTHVIILEQAPSLDGACIIEPVPPARAFTALLPHVHCFDPADPDAVARLTRHYLSVADAVPVYRLRYRPSFELFPAVLDALSLITGTVSASRP